MNSHAKLHEKSAFLSESAWKKVKNVALSNGMTISSLLSALVEMSDLLSLAECLSPTFCAQNRDAAFMVSVNGCFQWRRVVNGVIEIQSEDRTWYTFEKLPMWEKTRYGYMGRAEIYPLCVI